MTVWRIKVNRPGEDGEYWDLAKEYCRRAGVVGLGWGRPELLPDGASLEQVIETISAEPDEGPTGQRMIRRLAEKVRDHDLIWTKERAGNYWLGQIEGPWRYDSSDEARRWDIYNVRPCAWLPEPMRDFEVPGAVVRNFAGPGETLRRIKGPSAAVKMTELIFARESDPQVPWPPIDPEDVITDLMDPIDVEDIVLLLLQADGWLLLPSTRMHDTPVYEAALRHRDGGELAVVAVKSGASNPVPVAELAAAARGARAFAYSTHDAYSASPAEHGVTCLTRQELVDFMRNRPELLPPRIARWLPA